MLKLFLFFLAIFQIQAISDNRIDFIFVESYTFENGGIQLEDGSMWRIMSNNTDPLHEAFVIVLSENKTSGMLLSGRQKIPLTLLDGTPETERGFRTSLLFAHDDSRMLYLTDGTKRRVLDSEVELHFPSNQIVEIIITQDRRFAIDTNRGIRIPVSPPIR